MILITNKHSPEKLINHVLSQTRLIESILNKAIESHFVFHSGKKIQSGYFVTSIEVASIINDSTNPFVIREKENIPKWKNFVSLYVEPIKERFKEGLLTPPQNNDNGFGSNFVQFGMESDESSSDKHLQKKMPMKDFLKQVSNDYNNGKKQEVEKDTEVNNEEDEEEDEWPNNININSHDQVIPEEENVCTKFYDNHYWGTAKAVHLPVDTLKELLSDLD